ncbi:MAG: protein-disulfide reductase DsbD family protein, partial [Akkermansiaceae bacterium]|nr:protein-disulfide reductase DsbD family protein [Akkermansiaceae bacterium]
GSLMVTVVRLKVDEQWHVYWTNPGASGMPTTAEMILPEGWDHVGLLHPTPKKFKTGELHGFGHEGVVDYLLFLMVPDDFDGSAELQAKLSWLSCNDDACIPGDVTLKLTLADGEIEGAQPNDAAVNAAMKSMPLKQREGVGLSLKDGKDHWLLELTRADMLELDPAQATLFIATPELVDPAAELKFEKVGERWLAKCPKGEYAPQKPTECTILLVQEGKRAEYVSWEAK